MMKVCKCSKMWLSLALKNGQIYRKVFEAFSNVSIVLFWLLRSFFFWTYILRPTWRSCCKDNSKCDVFFFIREKKLLTSSEDYGKDLTGVQNLRKKHQRLEAELNNHEARIQVKISFFI